MKNEKLDKIRFLNAVQSGEIEPKATGERALHKWFKTHTRNQSDFYLILLHLEENVDVMQGAWREVEDYINQFYHEDIDYEFVFGSYHYDGRNLVNEYSDEKPKIVRYYSASNELIFCDKRSNVTRLISSLKDVPIEKPNFPNTILN